MPSLERSLELRIWSKVKFIWYWTIMSITNVKVSPKCMIRGWFNFCISLFPMSWWRCPSLSFMQYRYLQLTLTAAPGIASSISSRYHTFVKIDHEIISTVILLPPANHYRRVVGFHLLQYSVLCTFESWPRGYKNWVYPQTQNKAQWLAACGHVSASSQSLHFHFESETVLRFFNLKALSLLDLLLMPWSLCSRR